MVEHVPHSERRDIRVAAQRLQRLNPCLDSAESTEFAAAIANRYAQTTIGRFGLIMEFQQLALNEVQSHVTRESWLSLSPQLKLKLLLHPVQLLSQRVDNLLMRQLNTWMTDSTTLAKPYQAPPAHHAVTLLTSTLRPVMTSVVETVGPSAIALHAPPPMKFTAHPIDVYLREQPLMQQTQLPQDEQRRPYKLYHGLLQKWQPAALPEGVPMSSEGMRSSAPEAYDAPVSTVRDSVTTRVHHVPPVARVFQHSALSVIGAESKHSPMEAAASGRPSSPHSEPSYASSRLSQPPSIDIHHLTDQVVAAIDRRIVAQRERFGRI